MASGTPVVATTAGAVPEVAGEAAILVEPGDPAALAEGIRQALADRERFVAAGLERARQFSWAEAARRTLAVYRELGTRASTRGLTQGPDPELERCLDALRPQVDQLVVVANPPAPDAGATLIVNDKDLGFAANANKGIAATSAPYVVLANPDTEPRNDAVELLVEFAKTHPRAGVIGPQLHYPDGRWQPSRRRFPTVRGTLVRRTPLRKILRPETRQLDHYLLEDRPAEPAQADWMLAAFLLLRREMLDELGGFDEGYRLYGEDIDLCYRAAKAGWERWFVPQATVTHLHAAVTDRQFLTRKTLWHWRSIARFVRKHPERLRNI